MWLRFCAYLLLGVLAGCGGGGYGGGGDNPPIDNTPPLNPNPNILLIISDDVGLDASSGYTIGTELPATPTLDALAANGLIFDNAWANPVCSPTRATLLTGRYGYRTGVLTAGDDISLNETSLQSFIDTNIPNTYSHGVFGKVSRSPEITRNLHASTPLGGPNVCFSPRKQTFRAASDA